MYGISKKKIKDQDASNQDDKGFTLVEILIAIVLVGILSAVVVVGIGNLTSKGTSTACDASADSAKSGAVVFFTTTNAYPATLKAMTLATTSPVAPPALTMPAVTWGPAVTGPPAILADNRAVATSGGWTLTMTPSVGGAVPLFVCT